MRILHLTNMWPTREHPANGSFVQALVEGLRRAGGIHEVLYIPAQTSKMAYFKAVGRLKGRLEHEDYDLIHAQYAHCALIAALVSKLPVIAHYHGEFGYYTSKNNTRNWTGTVNRWDHHKDALLARFSTRLIKGGIVVNPAYLRYVACANKVVIPIGPDEDLFRPLPREEACTRLGWDAQPQRVLFPSDPRRTEKNYPLFVKVIKRIRELGVEVEPVVLSGIPYQQVPFYMSAADLLLLTSLTEASPTVLKEANFCELPVVACPVGDAALQLSGVKPGGVFQPDEDLLADASIEILKSRLRSNGRIKVNEWSLTRTVKDVLAFYGRFGVGI